MFVLPQSRVAAARAKRGGKRPDAGVIAHFARAFQWYSHVVLIVTAYVLRNLKRTA